MKNRRLRKTIAKAFVVCGALLFLVSSTALAQDKSSETIALNSGSNPVYAATTPHHWAQPGICVGLYDNVCGAGYNGNKGWKVSDGSPVNVEWSPAMQFTAVASGASTKITLGLSYVAGTKAAIAILTQDCGGAPCTTPDGTPSYDQLCIGKVGNLPKFRSTNTTTVTFDCKTQIYKGQKYWVILQSLSNSWLMWNFSNSTTGPVYDGKNDSWVNFGSQPTGALTVQ